MEEARISRSPVREEGEMERVLVGVVDWDKVIRTTPRKAAVQENQVRGDTEPPRRPSRSGVKIVVSWERGGGEGRGARGLEIERN